MDNRSRCEWAVKSWTSGVTGFWWCKAESLGGGTSPSTEKTIGRLR